MSKSPKAVQRRQYDRAWAQAVRFHADGICQRCFARGTDAHHVVSRRYKSTRYIMSNGVFLCRADHNEAHKEPKRFRAWYRATFPQRWQSILACLDEAPFRLYRAEES